MQIKSKKHYLLLIGFILSILFHTLFNTLIFTYGIFAVLILFIGIFAGASILLWLFDVIEDFHFNFKKTI